jgi:hypothetical protein
VRGVRIRTTTLYARRVWEPTVIALIFGSENRKSTPPTRKQPRRLQRENLPIRWDGITRLGASVCGRGRGRGRVRVCGRTSEDHAHPPEGRGRGRAHLRASSDIFGIFAPVAHRHLRASSRIGIFGYLRVSTSSDLRPCRHLRTSSDLFGHRHLRAHRLGGTSLR